MRGVTYTLEGGASGGAIPLTAVSDAGARELYWFVDDGFVGKARSGGTLLFAARPGRALVRVVDDLGLADARELRVEAAR